jgi:integrase/recombinase XerD
VTVNSFSAERAVSPLDGSELWVVLDPELVPHREASDFLRALHGASRSPHTIRVYAGRVASFLGWCASQGIEWSSVSLASLARFKHFVEATPYRGGRLRSGATVNARLTAVCEFLRFCARTGVIGQAVADQLSEPRWLRFTPPGFDAGESGQFRAVRARALKARAETPFPEALTAEQAETVLGCCRTPRERFLVILLHDTGMRIGEALGLRRADMHLLPDSRHLGCATVGAHIHVRHRANPNGALAKSRFPRSVPASDAVLSSYADYQHERAGLAGDDGTDLVLVNLYHEPVGAPMTYRSAKGFFDRLAAGCGFPVRPHMLRHTAATNWVRAGTDLDVVQALMGHASLVSTTVYLHARDEDKRRAVEAVAAGRRYR